MQLHLSLLLLLPFITVIMSLNYNLPPIKIRAPRQFDEECRTPTSVESKIPKIETCPPAPRKRRRVRLCKRNLSEMQFFQIVGDQEEIDSFFKSSFDLERKRRCHNTR
ncbi:hypothetical protein ACHQM5_010133 [Ranunculus cassubicifolius]